MEALSLHRVLSADVARMTSPATPPGEPNVRGFGWDIDSSYSANRGELLPMGSFGHTGFTGTSLWIDPATRVFIVFLSNRVHPDGPGVAVSPTQTPRGDVTALRARVATIVASALTDVPHDVTTSASFGRQVFESQTTAVPAPAPAAVMTGIDVLRADNFKQLAGLRIGLVTNHTGRARDGAATIDLLVSAPNVKLVSLLPEPLRGPPPRTSSWAKAELPSSLLRHDPPAAGAGRLTRSFRPSGHQPAFI